MKIRKLLLISLLGCATLQSYGMTCPAPAQIEPFISQYVFYIRAVPFPQCYYTAQMVQVVRPPRNMCTILYKSLSTALDQQYHLNISNWSCHDLRKERYNYDFTFTFFPIIKSAADKQ